MENRIRALRKSLGLSQEELAKGCGVSRQTINAIENNKYDPTLALAFKLQAVFLAPLLLALLLNLDDLAGDAHAADDQNQNRYDRQHGPYRLLAIFSTSALGHVFHSISNSFTMYATKEPRVLLHPRLQKM